MYPERIEKNSEQEWFGDDYFKDEKFAHCYIHEDYTIKMHSHQFYEINIIMKGEGRHYIADTSLAATIGDVFVIPPEISHGYYTEKSLDVYHIILKKSFINRYREELTQMPGYDLFFDIEPLIRKSYGAAYNLNIGADGLEKISSKIKQIAEAENDGMYMYENILVLGLVAELSRQFKNKVKNNKSENIEIVKVMEFIKKNLDSEISLADIAAYANMSTATLNRKFKSFLGVSPMKYVLICRIKYAEELMEEHKYSKTEVAQMSGFYDLAHLNKYLFKKEN